MKPDTIYRFVQELKRRRVFRGILVYGASVLVLFEAGTNLSQLLGRDSAPLWFVIMLGAGFFLSLWFSWVYDITPGGIRKTKPESQERVHIPKKEVRIYQTTTFVSGMLIIGLLAYYVFDLPRDKQIKAMDKTIAVLPYHNPSLSQSQIRTYEFVGQELTSRLWKIDDYKVLPWDECRAYMRRNKSYKEVGDDLKVCILVLWEPYEAEEKRHLSIDLIAVQDADLLWSNIYDIDGDWAEEVRRLSNKISRKITRKLRIYPSPQERALLGEDLVSAQASFYASLGDAYAQDAWIQSETGGMQKKNGAKNAFTDSISFSAAIKYYTDAINEDPNFAEAYANRAKAKLMGIRANFFDRSILDECWEDIVQASKIDKGLPEVHVATGFYYFIGLSMYELAAISFKKACDLRPGNTEYQFYLSKIYTTLGNWREVKVLSDKVFESNSQNALYYTNLGLSYQILNEYSKSDLSHERAITLLPGWYASYINKAYCEAFRGDISEARATLIKGIENSGKSFHRFFAELDLYDGNNLKAAKLIGIATEQEFIDLQESRGEAFLVKAKIYKHAGLSDHARQNFQEAAAFFEAQLKTYPDTYYFHSKLGLAYAGLGKKSQAIEQGRKALSLAAENYTAFGFPGILYDMAANYTLCGEYESAIYTLQELLNTHSLYTLNFVKLDPDLKPLLNESGFQNLVL
jgi:tetratricopeptide (TPR) repeat protein